MPLKIIDKNELFRLACVTVTQCVGYTPDKGVWVVFIHVATNSPIIPFKKMWAQNENYCDTLKLYTLVRNIYL